MDRRIDDVRPQQGLEWDAKNAAMDRAGELPLERRVAERRAGPPALVTVMAETVAALKEQLATVRLDALEEAAKACGVIASDHWDQYKGHGKWANQGNPRRADPHADGASDGASECEEAIRALASQPAAPVQPERALAEENRQLMVKANEWRDKFNESEESRHELLRLLNEETGGKTFMGEPVLPQRAPAQDVSGMVNRFLGWRLPDTFAPDCGISFDGRKDDEWNKNKSWPIGTNLLNATEAKAMFEYCLAAPPVQQPGDVRDLCRDDGRCQYAIDHGAEGSGHCPTGKCCMPALATTRPSTALTDEQRKGLQALANRIEESGEGPHYIGQRAIEAIRAILAASGGALAVPEWSATPPTEQAWYWHSFGDEDSAPFPLSVLYSGTAKKCFISLGQVGPDAMWCDEYGGYWLRMVEPAAPAIPAQGQTK